MYKRIYDSDEITVDLDGRKLRISVFEDGHWVDEHFVELPELEPVVHAHWVPVEGGTMCSGCKRVFDKDFEIRRNVCRELKRCPDCGAHMDEEVADA